MSNRTACRVARLGTRLRLSYREDWDGSAL
jgi:hypothetical protein